MQLCQHEHACSVEVDSGGLKNMSSIDLYCGWGTLLLLRVDCILCTSSFKNVNRKKVVFEGITHEAFSVKSLWERQCIACHEVFSRGHMTLYLTAV